ncbi:MAG TPA: hypothetical protein VKV69_07350, partial [Actinomycetota bacterium]|nr:hypothetical protein [Actinomycetota bacterium]
PEPAGAVLAGHALTALVLAGLIHAGWSETVPNPELRRRLEMAVTTGNPDDDHILDVLSRADDLLGHHVEQIHRSYVDAGARRLSYDVPALRELVAEAPNWMDRYIDLVERLRGNATIARDLLQTTELVCFDALPGGAAWSAPAFDHLFTGEHRNLLLVALGTLAEVAGKELSGRLDKISKIPFDRVKPSVPDRRRGSSPPHPSAADVPLALNPQPESEPS